jgi:hypothetical protein
MSLVEAIANVVVGLLVAVATQVLIFPVLGLQASLAQNLKLALVFTGVSIARSFLLRRRFEGYVDDRTCLGERAPRCAAARTQHFRAVRPVGAARGRPSSSAGLRRPQ